ncbi:MULTISPECIES: peptide ABC transporter substrate-binding protein [Salipiger]|uniref:Peptide/nickel transport system substrate-binding protein n=1 Tax=Salipiger profundus TaxID=1229727 RepID=A0A1U7DDX2_9RHOB|nr:MULTISPECIES: peptide ABC transporter substrate-binding protein [Salipiger]APX26260.1 peptide/nickel transport system substrate-binding protein [Salipiger profundus]GGA27545.1 peptide ABC transporter substrate-binding protein [Salipiger profundus]SFD74605.1 peptide/nickel transport system substrate-binding protein [Salipiger profundus]
MTSKTCNLNRRNFLKTGTAGLTLLMSGAAGSRLAAQDASGQVIIGFSQEPTVLHPHMPHIEVDEGVHFNLFDPLFTVNSDGDFVPALATEVPTVENGGVSEDGLKWRVKLREGVTWHDGEPFTAEDVKFTIELQQDPNFSAMRRTGHELVRNIEVVNDHEITWEMESPFAPYVSILSWTFIVPAHILADAEDPNQTDFRNSPVGTGAFSFGERVAGNYIQLNANPDWWGDGPYLETVIFRYIPDMTVLYTQFRTGDIDVIGLQGIQFDRFEQAKQLDDREVVITQASTVESISFNLGKPQFQDPAVREALYYALDKTTIIDAIYYGIPEPTESFLPKGSSYFHEGLPKSEYNLEKAKQILDEAGWVPGDDGVRVKDGVRLAFKNSTTAGNSVREQTQQFIQQDFAEIGVEMEISNLPPAVMWGEYWQMSEFDTAMVGIVYTTGPDPDVSNYFHSTAISAQGGAGQNTWQYQNEAVDELLEEGASLFVQEERKTIYNKLQEVVREDLPFLPIFQYANLRGHKAGLEGFDPNVNVRIETWNVGEWRWV